MSEKPRGLIDDILSMTGVTDERKRDVIIALTDHIVHAVVELHVPRIVAGRTSCSHCWEFSSEWPCPTIRVILNAAAEVENRT